MATRILTGWGQVSGQWGPPAARPRIGNISVKLTSSADTMRLAGCLSAASAAYPYDQFAKMAGGVQGIVSGFGFFKWIDVVDLGGYASLGQGT